MHSPREHFHTYLQSFDPERGALPEEFRAKLGRVLRHYGVTDLDQTPELEQAVFRVFLAQQRSTPDVRLVTAFLQRWIGEQPPRAARSSGPVRDVFDRLVTATQLRFPVVGELARSVRFRWFDQPLVDAERESVLGGVGRRDRRDRPGCRPGPERDARIDALAAIPEQIVRFLAERIEGGDLPADEPMLAVLIKRHYRDYALHDLHEVSVDGRPFAVADYTTDDGRPTWSRRSGGSTSWPPAVGWSRRVAAEIASVPPVTAAWSICTCRGPRRPSPPTRRPPLIAERLAGLGFAHEGAPAHGRHLPRRRPPGRLLHLPAPSPEPTIRTRRWPRTPWSAACTRWWLGG